MWAVRTAKDFTRMLGRIIKAWLKGRQVTVTYMKPEYDRPRVRTLCVSDISTADNGNIEILALDSYHGEVRKFRADRITHYTIHRTTFSIAELSDLVADSAADEVEENPGDGAPTTRWEYYAAVQAAAADWFEARGLEELAARRWSNALMGWQMADATPELV